MVKQTGDLDKKLGNNILSYRLAKNISRKELSKQVGITHQQMQKYEAGINRITVSRLIDIAEVLHIDPCHLVSMENADYGENRKDNKVVSEIIGHINMIKDEAKLEAVKNLVKSMA